MLRDLIVKLVLGPLIIGALPALIFWSVVSFVAGLILASIP